MRVGDGTCEAHICAMSFLAFPFESNACKFRFASFKFPAHQIVFNALTIEIPDEMLVKEKFNKIIIMFALLPSPC